MKSNQPSLSLFPKRPAGFVLMTITLFALVITGTHTAHAQATYKTLYNFGGADGSLPYGLLTLVGSNLYGTSLYGGAFGNGTVFEVNANGREKVLYSFTGGSDGSLAAGVISDKNGNLYGTTVWGGVERAGAVFKIDKSGNETVLHSFTGFPTDGENPEAGPVRDQAGSLYGTTLNAGGFGFGSVFKVDASGTETLLYSFTGGSDGAYPYGGLIIDDAGNLYGCTAYGGPYGTGTNGNGVVFKIDSAGNESVLYSFAGGTDGAHPWAGVIRDHAGNLFGTTHDGGSSTNCPANCGTVFKLDPKGTESILHNFTGYPGDGSGPVGNLVADPAGNLYGTTPDGGVATYVAGIVYKLSQQGKETVLHSFTGAEGAAPQWGMIRDSASDLYGVTPFGGTTGNGVVFEIRFP
jgi:uncharacterized repeat protein (TIGR03803 family)